MKTQTEKSCKECGLVFIVDNNNEDCPECNGRLLLSCDGEFLDNDDLYDYNEDEIK